MDVVNNDNYRHILIIHNIYWLPAFLWLELFPYSQVYLCCNQDNKAVAFLQPAEQQCAALHYRPGNWKGQELKIDFSYCAMRWISKSTKAMEELKTWIFLKSRTNIRNSWYISINIGIGNFLTYCTYLKLNKCEKDMLMFPFVILPRKAHWNRWWGSFGHL